MTSTRETLEAALVADPDSMALHSAYADLLIEEGDPRGEYIRLELSLEDDSLPVSDRLELNRHAESLFLQHRQAWLGRFFKYSRYADSAWSYGSLLAWRRGWLDRVEMPPEHSYCEALIETPVCRLLRVLVLNGGFDPLADELDIPHIASMLNQLRLRSFTLKDLAFWGDAIPEHIVNNGWLEHLEELNLSNCQITDTGAILLAQSPHVRKLKSLNLDYNFISPVGVAAFAGMGFDIDAQLDNPGWETDRDRA